jgi:endogenous inhibitor of DNA gyrase (YacG/DUF329 family)
LAAPGRSLYLFEMQRKCPTCRRVLPAEALTASYRPFCSDRCRTADLGGWLDGAYRIGAPLSEEDLDQGLDTEGGSSDPKTTAQ